MGRAKVTPEKNDGGMVVVLVLLMGALSYAAISAVHFYVTATATRDRARLPRLLSGWANIGNCFFHILVVCQLLTDTENLSKFFDDAEQPTAALQVNQRTPQACRMDRAGSTSCRCPPKSPSTAPKPSSYVADAVMTGPLSRDHTTDGLL